MEKLSSLFSRQLLIAIVIITLIMCVSIIIIQFVISAITRKDYENRYLVMITPAEDVKNNKQLMENNLQIEANPTPQLEGVVEVSMLAMVSGTGGRGLRMRQNPGSASAVIFLAQEGERVEIIDGPIIEDGYVWWKVISLDNPIKTGWSVQDFLVNTIKE